MIIYISIFQEKGNSRLMIDFKEISLEGKRGE